MHTPVSPDADLLSRFLRVQILQKPKVSPIKEQIRANIAEQCGTPVSVINVKAKTHEKVDSLGENRSVACHTVVSLLRKEDYPEK